MRLYLIILWLSIQCQLLAQHYEYITLGDYEFAIREDGYLFDGTAGGLTYKGMPLSGGLGFTSIGSDINGNLVGYCQLNDEADLGFQLSVPTVRGLPIDESWSGIDTSYAKSYSVSKYDIIEHIADFKDNGIIDNPNDRILNWPADDGSSWFPDKGLLPYFYDENNNDVYDPLEGDYPVMYFHQNLDHFTHFLPEEMVWYCYTNQQISASVLLYTIDECTNHGPWSGAMQSTREGLHIRHTTKLHHKDDLNFFTTGMISTSPLECSNYLTGFDTLYNVNYLYQDSLEDLCQNQEQYVINNHTWRTPLAKYNSIGGFNSPSLTSGNFDTLKSLPMSIFYVDEEGTFFQDPEHLFNIARGLESDGSIRSYNGDTITVDYFDHPNSVDGFHEISYGNVGGQRITYTGLHPHLAEPNTIEGISFVLYSDETESGLPEYEVTHVTSPDKFDPYPEFELYPNPSSGYFYLRSPSRIVNITIYDLLGRSVTQSRIRHRTTPYFFPSLNNGKYIFQACYENGECHSKFFTIRK